MQLSPLSSKDEIAMKNPPIHHEALSALKADPDGGKGTFDVIEDADGFNVYDNGQGLVTSIWPTLDEAVSKARELADTFDQTH